MDNRLRCAMLANQRADHLEDELVALTASNEALSRRVSELEAMEGKLAGMKKRYTTALELIGEKTEEVRLSALRSLPWLSHALSKKKKKN